MSSYDEVLGDTLAMVNVVRQAFGKDTLSELPDARPGDAGDCLFYRALGDLGVMSVTGSHATFADRRVASAVGELWGSGSNETTVRLPHQFQEVIGAFDGNRLSHYNVR